jgi:hypothetical protein
MGARWASNRSFGSGAAPNDGAGDALLDDLASDVHDVGEAQHNRLDAGQRCWCRGRETDEPEDPGMMHGWVGGVAADDDDDAEAPVNLHVKIHLHNIMDIGDESQDFVADVSVYARAEGQAERLIGRALGPGEGAGMSLGEVREWCKQRGVSEGCVRAPTALSPFLGAAALSAAYLRSVRSGMVSFVCLSVCLSVVVRVVFMCARARVCAREISKAGKLPTASQEKDRMVELLEQTDYAKYMPRFAVMNIKNAEQVCPFGSQRALSEHTAMIR